MARPLYFACSIALAIATQASAQSGWDRYAPGRLSAIIDRHRSSIDSTRVEAEFAASAETFPTRSTVIFAGKTRPIAADTRHLILTWATMMQIDTARVAAYREEWLFTEGARELWLPLQDETAASMRPSTQRGDSVTVWAQWFGAVTRNKTTIWVFPVMRAQTYR